MTRDICAVCDTEILGERVEAPAISRGRWACAEHEEDAMQPGQVTPVRDSQAVPPARPATRAAAGIAELREWINVFGPDLTVAEMGRLLS